MPFFTSDWHFGHTNIIRYCKRPYKDTEEMERDMIAKFNSRVQPHNETYFLGDLSFHNQPPKVKEIVSELNGTIHFIAGNHDRWKAHQYIQIGFESYHTSLEKFGKLLIHNPGSELAIKKQVKMPIICGHVHEKWKTSGKMINVSVDVWDFYPVPMGRIIQWEMMGYED